jgi:hypothetical protein
MKERFVVLNFGKIAVLPIFALVAIANYSGLNLSYNKYYIDSLISDGYRYTQARNDAFITNLFSLILVTGIFLLLTYVFYYNFKKTFLAAFIVFTILFQFFLISFLVDLNDMLGNYEYNSDVGVAAVVIIPITVISLFFAGHLFDSLKNSRHRELLQ